MCRVTEIALRLKHLIEQAVPCELKETQITKPHSEIITRGVIELAEEAGDVQDRACVVFCLLICLRWFKRQGEFARFSAALVFLASDRIG